MRGQLRAVVKARLGPHREAIGELVGRNLHRLRGEAIHRVRLVAGARHQRRKGQVHALRALALEDEGVERIEGEEGLIVGATDGIERKQPALRRIRIDVVEMLEVGGIFQVAEHRHAVRSRRRHRRPRRGRNQAGAQRADAEAEHVPAVE